MLKYLRERAGISQAGLAKAIGVTPASIGLYEQGRRQPAFEIEEKIADYFNVDLNTLRGITSDNYTKEEKEIITGYRKSATSKKQFYAICFTLSPLVTIALNRWTKTAIKTLF